MAGHWPRRRMSFLAKPGNKLHVVLTGGSSELPMMQALAEGSIRVKGKYTIERERADPRPTWMEDQPEELLEVYPQLAVAIGGTAPELPTTMTAPHVFAGGGERTIYVADQFPISGSQ